MWFKERERWRGNLHRSHKMTTRHVRPRFYQYPTSPPLVRAAPAQYGSPGKVSKARERENSSMPGRHFWLSVVMLECLDRYSMHQTLDCSTTQSWWSEVVLRSRRCLEWRRRLCQMAQEQAKLMSHPKKREWRVADGWSNLSKAFDRIPFDIFRASCEEHRIYSSRPVRLLKLNRSQGDDNGWLQWFHAHILIIRSRISGPEPHPGKYQRIGEGDVNQTKCKEAIRGCRLRSREGLLFPEHDGTYSVQYSTIRYYSSTY
jgi:hypothetical protein